jgi:hypothetical protein
LALLLRWYRWLRPGGQLRVETPDFEGCIANFSEHSIADQSMILRHVFGSQEAPWAQHRDGWSANRFRYVLGELGFTGVSSLRTYSDQRRLLPNVVVKAHRPTHGGPLDEDQQSAALRILRESMNGESETEETLFTRWRARFESVRAGNS